MKSSELILTFSRLSDEYGDLDVYCECDGVIQEAGSVMLFENVYVVMPVGQERCGGVFGQDLNAAGRPRT